MSLVGNLEDLGLGDILQIVSLSRKSGVLALHSRNREGTIIFLHGQVTHANSSVFRENLGDILLRKGLVDMETLKAALILQKETTPPLRLGAILAERFDVSKEAIEALVKEQIERIVYSYFGWKEGTFAFELGEPSELGATNFSPLQFMLEQGLNPQWLAMEGSRILDEKTHRGESIEDEAPPSVVNLDTLFDENQGVSPGGADRVAETGAVRPASAEPTAGKPVILFIDDDEATREGLKEALCRLGFVIRVFADSKEFMVAVRQERQKGGEPLLLIDLIMPRMDGTGILGGLELLESIKKIDPTAHAVMVSDHTNPEAERRVRELGAPAVLPKPKKSDIRGPKGPGVLQDLAETISDMIGNTGRTAHSAPSSGLFNLGAELLSEFGDDSDQGVSRGPESPGLHLLKGMLQELSNPSLGGGVILLVLRFASELMNRAVIFHVKKDEIVGLGQFGIELEGEMADARVRHMRIPVDQPSIFKEVLQTRVPMRVQLGSGQWDTYLRTQLGGSHPAEVFLGPVVSEGKVVALIYGDNLPQSSVIGDTEVLEIFLSQAGLAMEKTLPETRLRVKNVN
jgi:CheY-like chemotaxis protein